MSRHSPPVRLGPVDSLFGCMARVASARGTLDKGFGKDAPGRPECTGRKCSEGWRLGTLGVHRLGSAPRAEAKLRERDALASLTAGWSPPNCRQQSIARFPLSRGLPHCPAGFGLEAPGTGGGWWAEPGGADRARPRARGARGRPGLPLRSLPAGAAGGRTDPAPAPHLERAQSPPGPPPAARQPLGQRRSSCGHCKLGPPLGTRGGSRPAAFSFKQSSLKQAPSPNPRSPSPPAVPTAHSSSTALGYYFFLLTSK